MKIIFKQRANLILKINMNHLRISMIMSLHCDYIKMKIRKKMLINFSRIHDWIIFMISWASATKINDWSNWVTWKSKFRRIIESSKTSLLLLKWTMNLMKLFWFNIKTSSKKSNFFDHFFFEQISFMFSFDNIMMKKKKCTQKCTSKIDDEINKMRFSKTWQLFHYWSRAIKRCCLNIKIIKQHDSFISLSKIWIVRWDEVKLALMIFF
jgi:hypothetical protein